MALYRLELKAISRSNGHAVVAKAAYNAGQRLLDEERRRAFDFSYRPDVKHVELLNSYGRSREELWNEVEWREGERPNALLAREVLIALPQELALEQQIELARELAIHIARTYQVAVDLAVHAPAPDGDRRSPNVHAHLLFTRRVISEDDLTESLEMWDDNPWGTAKRWDGEALVASAGSEELRLLRRVWAEFENRGLERGGRPERVDERSYLDQGLDRIPGVHLGRQMHRLEEKGIRTDAGDYNRLVAWANRLREVLGPEWDPEETIRRERTKETVGKELRAIRERILGGLQDADSRRRSVSERGGNDRLLPKADLGEIEMLVSELRQMLHRLQPELTALIDRELDLKRAWRRSRNDLDGMSL